jgi:hypothetical protein
MIFLSGCATNRISTCPEPTKIDPKVQAQAAEEIAALPENSAIEKLLVAGLNDRDKLRACRAIR